MLFFSLVGCHGLGNNTAFLLQNKKDLREYYAVDEERGVDKSRGSRGDPYHELIEDRDKYLPRIYTSNLPYSLTDEYDVRTAKEPIRAGSPLNVIINKVHIRENGELLSWIDTGEIATVVTVIDGKEEPRHVLVSYEKGIPPNVDLPIRNVLAYSTDSYGDEPIGIEVTVFDLDQKENNVTVEILNQAAAVGKTFSPAFAPLLSLATEVGKKLIDASQEDAILKFSFWLYPWKAGAPGRVSANMGIPRVFAKGIFAVINDDKPITLKDTDEINVDWDLHIFKNPHVDLSNVPVLDENKRLRCWPIPLKQDFKRHEMKSLDANYLVLTINDTPLSSAGKIISQNDSINRQLANLDKQGRLVSESAKPLLGQLDDLRSNLTRVAGQNSFDLLKWDPKALDMLFQLHDDKDKEKEKRLNDTDKALVLNLIRYLLPEIEFDKLNADAAPAERLREWYQKNKAKLSYNKQHGKYEIPENSLGNSSRNLEQSPFCSP